MGGSRKRHGQKKSENNPPESWYNELIAVKETIAGLQKKLENSIESNEMLRCLNTVLVNDLKMEKESKTPFMQAFQVRNFSNQFVHTFLKKKYSVHRKFFQDISAHLPNPNIPYLSLTYPGMKNPV